MARAFPRLFGMALLFGFATSAAPVPAHAQGQDDTDPAYNGKKGSEWVKVLVDDTSARKRALAIDALAKLWADKRYKDSLGNIGRALRLDSSAAVRVQAAIALGGLNEKDAEIAGKDLADAMGTEKESRVRKEIAGAIARYPIVARAAVAPLTGALKDSDPATRAAVADALAQAGSDAKSAAAGLVPLLQDPEKPVRLAAVIALGRTAPEGAPAIAETLAKMLGTEKDTDMRVELVSSLGLLAEKSPAVVTALAALLTDPEDELRRRAARVLGTFGTAAGPAADVLLKVATTDKMKDIRVDAVRAFGSALGRDGLKARVKDLIAQVIEKEPEFEVRAAAVEEIGALGNDLLGDAETMKALRRRLSDPHVKVRKAVEMAIKNIEKKPDPKKDPEPKKEP